MRNDRLCPTLTLLSRAAMLAVMSVAAGSAHAASVTWTNGAGNGLWNSTDVNWSGASWNNLAGNDAIFGAIGVGAVTVGSPIMVNSIDFQANGYVLGGSSSLTLGTGNAFTSTSGWITTEPGVTAHIDAAIVAGNSLVKGGAGILELAGPVSFNGIGSAYAVGVQGSRLINDVIVSGISGISLGGTLKIMNNSVLPSTTRVGIGNGVLDLGANNITIGALNFVNQADNNPWNTLTNSSPTSAVIGTGTLRVLGEINVMAVDSGDNGPNSIATNLDLGGGTQIIRASSNGAALLNDALIFSGTLSNGSLIKTLGYTQNAVLSNIADGITLMGNNTYTGSSVFNGGTNVVTGTNASSLIKVYSNLGGVGNTLTLQGANGSYQAAHLIQAANGGVFVIDNNAALGRFSSEPVVAAAQNNDRIRDDAVVQLNRGAFVYRNLTNTAGSETFGTLDVAGGHNLLSLTANGTGSVTLTAGALNLAPGATLQITSATLGGASKFFVTGNAPAADATGIVRNVVGSSDFLSYSASSGFAPFTGYSTNSFATVANVALTAASTLANSAEINALKTTGSFTTTIASGQALTIDSGMVLSASGTATFTGGTIAFGNTAATFFGGSTASFGAGAGYSSSGGSIVVNSAITGTQGLVNASSNLTLNGDLSGLSGDMTNSISTTLATNTFAGSIYQRIGILSVGTSQTLAGQGAIHLGDPTGDANLIASVVGLNFSGAGANATIARNIVVDTGQRTSATGQIWYAQMAQLIPLSNSTGSQTVSGDILLNSPLRLQGGSTASGKFSTNFTGNISGAEMFEVANGYASFSGNLSNAGGFRIGEGGFSAEVTFAGTTTGSAPVTLEYGSKTTLSYMPGSLPTGTLTIENATTTGNAATILPLANSTINNVVNINGYSNVNVGAGITAVWNGQINGNGGLNKLGTGTLAFSHVGNTYSGPVTITAGTLQVNGALPGSAITVAAAGTLAPGVGVGTMSAGSLSLAGTLQEDIDLANGGTASADLLQLGSLSIAATGALSLSLTNDSGQLVTGTYLLASLSGSNPIGGTFSSVTGLAPGYSVSVNYAFSGLDSLGRTGDGNDLAVTISAVPEPSSYALLLAGLAVVGRITRRRRD